MRERKTFHWAWIILGTCFVNLFINYSVRLGYSVVLPEMIQNLGFSRTAGGSVYNAYFLLYVALTPLAGYLTDRIGARQIITVCAGILGGGVLLMGSIRSFGMACLAFAVVGLGSTGMWTPIITVVQRWFAPNRRGLALGILSTGYGLGFATMGVVFPRIVNQWSWRYAWYFLGAAALVMILANGLLLRSDPESTGYQPWGQKGAGTGQAPATPWRPQDPVLSRLFRDRTFWLVGLSYFAISYSLYGITTFMVDYARSQFGVPLEKASLLATIHGTCQVIGVLTVLPMSDYLGRRRTLIFSNSLITACLAGIILSGDSWSMLCLFVGIMAVFYGATFPMYGACAGDFFPRQMMGTVIGVWTPFYGLGAISVHWVSGLLRDSAGCYDTPFLINAVMAAIGSILISLVKQKSGA
ncbi:MAG: transporter [Thermodesulfobacteriota bacterium]|nr:transporter [Thermodesulfobacteriota bacterium]